MRSLLRTIAALGAVLVTTSVPAQGPTESTGTGLDAGSAGTVVRVASYNTWGLPVASQALVERYRRLPAALLELKADVLCLQEVWTGALRKKILDGLGDGWHATGMPRGGLLTVSRLPVSGEEFVALPVAKHMPVEERLAGKGILSVVVATPAGPLRLVNSHLSHGDHENIQRRFLNDHVAKSKDIPIVLGADVNTAPDDHDFQALLRGGFADAMPMREIEGGRRIPWPPTRVGWPRPESGEVFGWRPDCVLYRSGGQGSLELRSIRLALDTAATALSDHNLLLAEFRLSVK